MNQLDTKKKALEWLYQDELHHVMTIDLLERGNADILFSGNETLVVASDDMLLIHCRNEEERTGFFQFLQEELSLHCYWVVKAHDVEYLEALRDLLPTEPRPYYNAIYPDDAPIPKNKVEGLEIHPLTMEEFQYVRSHYKTVDDDEYITWRIQSGSMLGAWLDGELTGFIGTHGDGAMGLMEVDPAYRRLGIGRALEGAMIRRQRQKKLRTFGNVDALNSTAREVHEKVGSIVDHRPVYWLFTKG